MRKNNHKNENLTASDEVQKKRLIRKRTVAIISFIIFVGILLWLTYAIGKPLVEAVFDGENGADTFTGIVERSPIGGRLMFIGIQILQVFIAFIPGEAVEIAAGLAFGTWEGLLLCLLGVALGSSVIFLLTKTLGHKFVELFVSDEQLNDLAIIRSDTRLNALVFLFYFIPGTPKDVLTYFVATTRMKLSVFLLISLFARIPSVLTSTWCGSEIISGNYTTALIIFAVTGVLGAAGLLSYRAYSKKHSKNASADANADSTAADR